MKLAWPATGEAANGFSAVPGTPLQGEPALSCAVVCPAQSLLRAGRILGLCVALISAPVTCCSQGLVNFFNSTATLISVMSLNGPVALPGSSAGQYYFALLTAPEGTTDRSLFAFSGLYATNLPVDGRISGGSMRPVPGWAAATRRSYFVCGWSADMGTTFDPAWLSGRVPPTGYFGWSMIGTGIAGGVDIYGQYWPSMYIFGGSGRITSGFTLSGWFPPLPQLYISPWSQTVTAGSMAMFWAMGSAFSSYQWQLNNADIAGATNSVLSIPNVQPSQAGTYTVIGRGGPGGVTLSASATLSVLSIPVITASPASQTVTVGVFCSFSVTAVGAPPMYYQWYFGEAALPGATAANLSLENVQLANAGDYSVAVSNTYGLVRSASAALIVTADPPVITASPRSQTVEVGEDVTFSVTAGGSLPLGYQWFYNGQPIPGARLDQLHFTDVRASQAGDYTVVVTNAFGAATSGVARLTIVPGFPYAILHHFDGYDGKSPSPNLVLVEGTLYGTTLNGGLSECGTVYRLSTNGTQFSVLKRDFSSDEQGTWGGVIFSADKLYGTTWGGGTPTSCGTIFALNTNGSGYTTLHQFVEAAGRAPMGSLLAEGPTLFGTTYEGGTYGYGTVFRINMDGSGFTVLKHFTGADGCYPHAQLVLSEGVLYGTASSRLGTGNGLVFRLNADGSGYTVLKDFSGTDGTWPSDELVLSGTTLYGTTRYSGSGGGTLFKINTDGSGFSMLKRFAAEDGGADPWGNLVLRGSSLYGSLFESAGSSYGAIYRIGTDGSDYRVLKRFSGESGGYPYALILDGSTLYGVAQQGGMSNCGVIFSISMPVPAVRFGPETQTAEVGSSASFRIHADGAYPFTYQWLLNGTNIILVATNALLEIPRLQFSDAGAYSVMISNSFGSVTSAPALLSVIPVVNRRMVPALSLSSPPATVLNIEVADSASAADWNALAAVLLVNSSQCYFDLSAPLPAQRFYRASATGAAPGLDLHMVAAITLSGSIGSSARLDYINQRGPIDAWIPLASVVLTNTSQLYFDTSAIGQPLRLYRLTYQP
jgi:uncharacterized repeat protein (TIGR03803 family)